MLGIFLLLLFPLVQNAAPPADPTAHVDAALRRLTAADQRRTRYTRFKLEHNLNFDDHDQKTTETEKLYEDTWINGLPYSRLVELNGEPLRGNALATEQGRYDEFVTEHRALDLEARAKLMGGRLYAMSLNVATLSSPAYHLTLQKTESCTTAPGQSAPCHKYLADPVADRFEGQPVKPFHCELWVTDGDNPLLTRLNYTLAGTNGEVRDGSGGDMEWQLFDDTPVPSHTHFTGFVKPGRHTFRAETDNTYTRYRRFATSVTLRPGSGDLPPEPTEPTERSEPAEPRPPR